MYGIHWMEECGDVGHPLDGGVYGCMASSGWRSGIHLMGFLAHWMGRQVRHGGGRRGGCRARLGKSAQWGAPPPPLPEPGARAYRRVLAETPG